MFVSFVFRYAFTEDPLPARPHVDVLHFLKLSQPVHQVAAHHAVELTKLIESDSVSPLSESLALLFDVQLRYDDVLLFQDVLEILLEQLELIY
jgi:hypothetical protein